MPWVRREDQASISRKVSPLDDAAYRLWSEAMEWCSRNATDGRILPDELGDIKRGTPTRAAVLQRRKLWHAAGDRCVHDKCPAGPVARLGWYDEDGGWVIHDYLEFNPSKADVLAERAAKAERQKRWRDRKNGRYVDASRNGARDVERDDGRDGPGDASGDTSADGPGDSSRDASVTSAPSRPVPPRPEGRRGEDAPQQPPAAADAAGRGGGGWGDQNHAAGDPRPPSDPAAAATARAQARAAAVAASRRSTTAPSPMDRLREATPEVAPLLEPEPAATAEA